MWPSRVSCGVVNKSCMGMGGAVEISWGMIVNMIMSHYE